ncbi:iron ABC transporter substrate-binding protein, partial [Klebsiella michiganensis]
MYMKISGLVISLTAAISGQVLAAVPQGYPADYQKVVDAGIKEDKVVIYSTTDTKA